MTGLLSDAPVRALFTIPQACEVLSISRSQIYREVARGRLKFVHSGRRSLITAQAIQHYVAMLEADAERS